MDRRRSGLKTRRSAGRDNVNTLLWCRGTCLGLELSSGKSGRRLRGAVYCALRAVCAARFKESFVTRERSPRCVFFMYRFHYRHVRYNELLTSLDGRIALDLLVGVGHASDKEQIVIQL